MTIRLCALLATLALAAGCTPEASQESAAPAAGTAAVPTPAPEPAAVIESAGAPLAAIVLGEEIRSSDAGEMQQVVLTRLFDRYAADHGIEVTDEEVGAWVERMQRAMAEDPNLDAEDGLTPEEATQVEEMRREMGRSMIRQWKLDRALFQQYGGRVIYQQLGPEPLDAYLQYLEERQAAGDFTIVEPAFAAEFWRYFTDDSMHDFFEPGTEASAYAVAPWER